MPTPKQPRRSRAARPRQERHILVYGVQRDRPDLRKLSRAVIAMAQAEAEREAQAQHQTNRRPRGDRND
ncbi:hypothetical protein GU243_08975 [Pseudarthrobacter psychrotolerans]|uniref:Uncharacterized protein n=1 Tax=Pseudarthrobacter psychrotolerans TaxID=2697569 RepID=A0A6P1NKI0_9MICC|nr:hypothetical protein [Pseudarthrobacter psychrotolerans]QHK19848.1 hypothetical protein GU243_08975 [Pseudarthrobacter psychrotolerans]